MTIASFQLTRRPIGGIPGDLQQPEMPTGTGTRVLRAQDECIKPLDLFSRAKFVDTSVNYDEESAVDEISFESNKADTAEAVGKGTGETGGDEMAGSG